MGTTSGSVSSSPFGTERREGPLPLGAGFGTRAARARKDAGGPDRLPRASGFDRTEPVRVANVPAVQRPGGADPTRSGRAGRGRRPRSRARGRGSGRTTPPPTTRLVLRLDQPVPLPRRGLHVRRRAHDRGASDPRLGKPGRSEPAPPRARAKEVGRNPRVVEYQASFGPSASYYAWEAAGRPVHGCGSDRDVPRAHLSRSASRRS